MEPILAINLLLLWGVALLLSVLVLTTVRRMRSLSQMVAAQMSLEAGSILKLTVGEPAPDFTAFSQSGQPVTLSTYLGNHTAFIFIDPHCEPCRNELPELIHLNSLAKSAGVDMALVTMAIPSDMVSLIKEYNIQIPILYSPPQQGTLTDLYNPTHVYPFYCLIDKQGKVVSTNLISSGDWQNLIQNWK